MEREKTWRERVLERENETLRERVEFKREGERRVMEREKRRERVREREFGRERGCVDERGREREGDF